MDSNIVWLAGLFDGEGTVQIASNYQIIVSIKMNHKPTIERILEVVGFGYIRRINEPRNNRKIAWRYEITRRDDASRLLSLISPYCVTKKTEVDLAVEYCLLSSQNRSSRSSRPLTDVEHTLRQHYRTKLQELKKYEYVS